MKLKAKWKKLTNRMLIVVCATFLPLNLMAVAIAGVVIVNSSNEIYESYSRELTLSMNRMETDLLKIADWMDAFVLKYLSALMLENGSDNMVSYEMTDQLGEIYKTCNMKGMILLYDKNEKRPYVKYGDDLYTVREMEQIKKQALRSHLLDNHDKEWVIAYLGERYFYAIRYDYSNYKLAFLVDMNAMFEFSLGQELLQKQTLYFTDYQRILQLSEDGMQALVDTKWKDLFREKLFYRSVLWNSENLNCGMGMSFQMKDFLGMIPLGYWVLLVIAVFSVLGLLTLWKLLQRQVVKPLNTLRNGMKELEVENFDYRIEGGEPDETEDFMYLYDSFNQMAQEIKESHEKDIKMYEAQLNNLRLQVNPHMLLNSFNMIYSLAQTKNFQCIQEFSLYLVEYFRYVLKENDTFVTLEKEMKFVQNYIGIQKIRFPGTFTSVYDMEEGTEKALVPPLLIQNFVENAMKYALVPGKLIEVLINIRRDGGKLLVSVCDTGSGIKEEVLEALLKGEVYVDKMGHKHIGIWNCRRRMEVFYGSEASMNLMSSRGTGTQVWLELPYMEVRQENTDAGPDSEGRLAGKEYGR